MALLYRLDINIAQEHVEFAQAQIFQYIQHGWEEENLEHNRVLIRLHCELQETLEEVRKMLAQEYPDTIFESSSFENKNWTEAWKEFFTPVEADLFVVVPAWEKEYTSSRIPLYIDPKSAFGTGHHATTALCLHAISALYKDKKIKAGQKFLDLGCGTGILGIACQKLGLTGLCCDIDPVAIENTKENYVLNSPSQDISLDIAVGSIEVAQGPYDIIIANILAGPLKVLSKDIMSKLKKDGILVLSGILSSQAQDVCDAYKELGIPQLDFASDIPHICPENIATNEIKPSETWVCITWKP